MMDAKQLAEARRVCAAALNQCRQAEQSARQEIENAGIRRSTAQHDSQQRREDWHRNAQAILNDARQIRQEADGVLAGARLGRGTLPASPQNLSQLGIDALDRQMRSQRDRAQAELTHLTATAQTLAVERTKWWKFW